jgi:hypothetical protein
MLAKISSAGRNFRIIGIVEWRARMECASPCIDVIEDPLFCRKNPTVTKRSTAPMTAWGSQADPSTERGGAVMLAGAGWGENFCNVHQQMMRTC